jgi:hypothetical protein
MNDPFRPYRKAFRAWRSLRRLDREREHYRREFDRRGLSVPDPDAIMRAVKARRPRLARLPRGALHTLAIFHDYNRERTAFMPALGKFGEAVCYDWRDRFDHGSKDWRKKLKGEMNRDLLEFARALSKKRPLGFIFTYLSGELVTPETVRELSNLGAPMVNLALNDREAFVGRVRDGAAVGVRDLCRHFDLCWTSTRDALEKYCVEGAIPVYLPEGANPEIHRPYEVELTFAVSFVGQCHDRSHRDGGVARAASARRISPAAPNTFSAGSFSRQRLFSFPSHPFRWQGTHSISGVTTR